MSLRIIEINGSGITVYGESGILLESPAYATVDGKTLLLGDEARAKARLKPTETSTYFWDQLAVDPLPKPLLNARHHADIAYWHLRDIWEQIKEDCDELILAVAGNFNETQLGLLIGITKSLEIPVTGLIDAALAACDGRTSHAPVQLHLDIQLHRIVVTRLALNAELRRVEVRELVGTGLIQLHQVWMELIRDVFVRLTRFDPMHRAQTEQQLFSNLQSWLLRLLDEDTLSLELYSKERVHGITLNRDDLVRSAANTYGQILRLIDDQARDDESVELHLSHRLWSLPGLTERIVAANLGPLVNLEPQAPARGVMKHRSTISRSGEVLRFITQLPRPTINSATDKDVASRDIPTHILYRSHAYRIGEQLLTLGTESPAPTRSLRLRGPLNGISRRHCSIYARDGRVWIEDHSTYGTYLNEQKIDGRTSLHTGDRVRIGTPGEVMLLITEVNPNAA